MTISSRLRPDYDFQNPTRGLEFQQERGALTQAQVTDLFSIVLDPFLPLLSSF
jgi:hypothetical protein